MVYLLGAVFRLALSVSDRRQLDRNIVGIMALVKASPTENNFR